MWWMIGVAAAATLPDLDRPLKSGAQAPDDAAVIIGIEDYYELPPVPYATRDAQAFSDFLLYTRGVPSDQIANVLKGNREKMLKAVSTAAGQVGPDGTLWIYFAGHGGASPETGERVLMGIDVQPDLTTFTARSVSVAELREAAIASGADVTLVLDTCYTGVGRSGAELLPGKRFAVPAYATEAPPKVLEWSAASANQFSGPLDAAQHGAFTWAVLGALRGWADGQLDDTRDGTVTAEEARLYVEETLRTLGVTDQVPQMVVESARAWELAEHPKSEGAPSLDDVDLSAAPAADAAPAAATPDAEPAPGASSGTSSVCFKRSKSAAGSAVGMEVAIGARVIAEVKTGKSVCVELEAGTHILETYHKSNKKMRGALPLVVAPGTEAWVFIGLVSSPRIVEVSEDEYHAADFKILKR